MIITLTGPTCSGKSTIESALHALGFGHAISHTTRAQRATDVNGKSYHFVTEQQFDTLNDAGEFIETIEFSNARYAMSSEALLMAQADHNHVAIVVDPSGARQIQDFCLKNNLPCFAVWVDCNPTIQAQRWMNRLAHDLLHRDTSPMPSYTERLGAMLSEEISWRINAAVHGDLLYDKAVETSRDTPETIAAELVKCVNSFKG